jgi:RNA-directed DNA polymerase
MIIVRYADDIIVGFQYRHEAERYVDKLTQRLADLALQPNLDKTRLI